ncbi:hypothetical protein [Williamsia serinedens]|uniref:hypothetical protein n=1 Tax=Williamsia serinedens TaxID=391736 RepID=UPI0020A4ABCF|nr:hypothetical protein [Williamsia serinedens]
MTSNGPARPVRRRLSPAGRVLTILLLAASVVVFVRPITGEAAPPPRDAGVKCVGSSDVTLPETYDAIVESLAPSLPPAARTPMLDSRRDVLKRLTQIGVASTTISDHPYGIGATADSPMLQYRNPLSTFIVTQLIRTREGKAAGGIRLDHMTLSQAVETAYFYIYVTFIVPASIISQTVPPLFPVNGIGLGTLISLPLSLGSTGMGLVLGSLSNGLANACLARKTQRQIDEVHSDQDADLRFTRQVPSMLDGLAAQVRLADKQKCPSIGVQPLSRIVARTSDNLRRSDPRSAARVTDAERRIQSALRTTRINRAIIPTDQAEFTTVETVLSTILSFVPSVGGPITNAIVGLGAKAAEPADRRNVVPLADLPVADALTGIGYGYAVTTQMLKFVTGNVGSGIGAALSPATGGLNVWNLVPSPWGLINAPNTYGITTYNNVLRSLCFAEDYRPSSSPR